MEWHQKKNEWHKQAKFLSKAATEAMLEGGFQSGALDSLEALSNSLRNQTQEASPARGIGSRTTVGTVKSSRGRRDAAAEAQKDPQARPVAPRQLQSSASMPALTQRPHSQSSESVTAGSEARIRALENVEQKLWVQRQLLGGSSPEPRGASSSISSGSNVSGSNTVLGRNSLGDLGGSILGSGPGGDGPLSQSASLSLSANNLSTSPSSLFSTSHTEGRGPLHLLKRSQRPVVVNY